MKLKLEEYITELAMKSDTKIDVKRQKGMYFNAKITLENGVQWFFNATNEMDDDEWDIAFYSASGHDPLTGNKNQMGLQTFAAVEKLVIDFIEAEDPEEFHFSATGKSRVKLYNTLAKKILKSGKYKKGTAPKLLMGSKWSFIKG